MSLVCCCWYVCCTSGCQHKVKPGKREIHLTPTSGTKKTAKPILPLVMAAIVKCMCFWEVWEFILWEKNCLSIMGWHCNPYHRVAKGSMHAQWITAGIGCKLKTNIKPLLSYLAFNILGINIYLMQLKYNALMCSLEPTVSWIHTSSWLRNPAFCAPA